MKSRDQWKPSKYVYRNGKLTASRDPGEVSISSRLIGDRVAEFYDHNLREHAKGKLLDLGCGKVPLFLAYKDHVTDNVCVDWEHTLHKNDYVDFECDLTKSLPFEDGEFDTVLLSDVLEHIPQPEHLWAEIARILAQNGKLIMNVPFYYWIHEQPHDYYRYTEFALRRFVEGSGLRLIQLDRIGGANEIMADIFAKNVHHVPLIGPSLAKFSQWLAVSVIGKTFGKTLSEANSGSFPFGYFLIAEKPE
jgi:SAM-dependent methyltransferase